jgi:hypothetical protein
VAAGPALVRVATTRSTLIPSAQSQIHRNLTWAATVHAAYDFYFVPAFSMGAFAEYRWLKADVPEYAYTADLEFYQANDLYGSGIRRTTEVRVPGRTVELGGFAYGLRLGLRF